MTLSVCPYDEMNSESSTLVQGLFYFRLKGGGLTFGIDLTLSQLSAFYLP